MSLIGSLKLDERAITRDGAKVTATVTGIPVSEFYFSDDYPAIAPTIDQILIHYYNGKTYIRSEVVTITAVHEYQIDVIGLDKVKTLTLKFSFIDQEKVSTESVIKPVIVSLLRCGTALAVEFAGAFDEMKNDELTRVILSDYAAFTHLGIKYQFVKVHMKLISQGDSYNDETHGFDFHRAASGVIAMYTSTNPPVSKDQVAVQAIMVNKILRYSKDRPNV